MAVRRRVSIDFNIPPLQLLQPVAGRKGATRYYLPLSVLKKWPPPRHLDLRDGSSQPLPLLTREQNGIADAALLIQLAAHVLKVDRPDLDPYLSRQLERIAQGRPSISEQVWNELFEYAPEDQSATFDAQRAILRENDYFLNVAGGLVDSTILWLRTIGEPRSRHIVKFAFDAPVDLRHASGFKPAALGWQPLNFALEVPHIGTSGSYHLQFRAPAPVRVTDARLELFSLDELDDETADADASRSDPWVDFARRLFGLDRLDAWLDARAPLRPERFNRDKPPDSDAAPDLATNVLPDPDQRPAPEVDDVVDSADTAADPEGRDGSAPQTSTPKLLAARAERTGPNAHFYVSGERPRTWGRAQLTLLASKRGFIRASAIASSLIFALLLTYRLNLPDVIALGAGALTMLLLVPGLLGYLVIRPGEHPLATTFLRSVRMMVLLTGLLPVLAAGSLVINGRQSVPPEPARQTPPPESPPRGNQTEPSPAGPEGPARSANQGVASERSPDADQRFEPPSWLRTTFSVFTAVAGVFMVILCLSWLLPPRYLRRPFSHEEINQPGIPVIDPVQSPSEISYKALSARVADSEDDPDALTKLSNEVASAQLAEDEREHLVDRIRLRLAESQEDSPAAEAQDEARPH